VCSGQRKHIGGAANELAKSAANRQIALLRRPPLRTHCGRKRNPAIAREMLRARSTLAISSHEVVSHINYSKAECCEFLIGFQPLVLFVHNERAHGSIQSEFRNSSTSRIRRALE
jgi:hypothetical protein